MPRLLTGLQNEGTKKLLVIIAAVIGCAFILGVAGLIGWRAGWQQSPAVTEESIPSVNVSEASPALPAEGAGLPPKPERITGIGVILVRNRPSGKWMVSRVFPDSPAAKAGLSPGVLLETINGVGTDPLRITDVSALLRGPAGTTVSVVLLNPAMTETNRLDLIREEFNNNSK